MFWDMIAGIYDLFGYVINGEVNRQLCDYVVSCLEETDKVLECACGTGMITAAMAGKVCKITATDYSEKMLEKTRKKCKVYNNVEIRKADITDLPFEDNSFDAIIAANVIHLLDEPYRAVSELYRVCRKGGKIIIPTYVNRNSAGKASLFATAVSKSGADFKRQFTFEDYGNFFKRAGYCMIDEKHLNGTVPCAIAVIRKTEEG